MKCPYCCKDMEEGSIPTDRYNLKWKPMDGGIIQSIFDIGKKNVELTSFLDNKRVFNSLLHANSL
ncbi:PF20097 family protein [Lachnoanaerobaculum gingivalis]|uniref:PF20097 family protein n=1 Tax=Lachnoanaerobaculum gingivalis TaxID=2490855 RepID=UPI0024A77382|nr:PF20097 family protein [Lachnoanaerobaculum gingivalis]WHE87081.1 PF20097 family protein [Lachnoanaerobaculum gingivalis]